eukprot:evm.model.NODE_26106_length_11607_cov_37.765743.3
MAGSASSDSLVKMVDFRQLEELRIGHDGDVDEDRTPYGTRLDINAPAASFKTVVRGACLIRLTMACIENATFVPLRIEAQRLRDVYLQALKADGLVIDDGRAQLGNMDNAG